MSGTFWASSIINPSGKAFKKSPGFDLASSLRFLSSKEINKLNIEEIVSIKEAIKRDEEAINFVLNLSKETSASKKLLEKIIKGESVKI